MDLKLSGKRALVTGSTAGIGEAIARLLAVEGACIAIHGRDEGRGNQLVDELKGGGTRTVFIKADLSVPDDIVALAEQARTTLVSARDLAPKTRLCNDALQSYIDWGARIAVAASQPGFKIEHVGPVPAWDWPTPKDT